MPVDPSKREQFLDYIVREHKEDAENVVWKMHGPQLKIPFMSPMLTWATTGGVPVGHFCRWYGPEHCISADTHIPYEVRSPDGKTQNRKGGTIERLYERFHGVQIKHHPNGICQECGGEFTKRSQKIYCGTVCRNAAMGRRTRDSVEGSEFFTASINDKGRVIRNKITGVVNTGRKHVYELSTDTGESIVATGDHKFLVPGGQYVALENLGYGDTVFAHQNVNAHAMHGLKSRVSRPQTTVKHHPYGSLSLVNGFEYRKLYVARLIMEAYINGLSLDEYKDLLNEGELDGLTFLTPDHHVHHIDEDPSSNELDNLAVVLASEHNRMHAKERHNNLRFIVVEVKVADVVHVGEEDTYDIQMASPYNNYIANGIVVHNSGKSLTNWGLIAAAQNLPEILSQWYEVDIKFYERRKKHMAAKKIKKELDEIVARFPNGMETILFDTEQRADEEFATKIGVDVGRMEIINNNVIEEIIKDATAAIEAYHIVTIDSATNAQSVAEASLEPGAYERGTGAQAWKRLRQLRKRWDRNENVLIIVDQVRTQLGQTAGKNGQSPVSPPNVRFIRHNSSLSISYDVGKKLYLDKNLQLTDDYDKASTDIRSLGTNGKEPHGIEMRCKVDKNSSGKPYRSARMRFRFPVADIRTGELIQEVGFDQAFEMVEIATHFEIMDKQGSRWYPLDEDFEPIPNPKNKGKTNISYHGEAAAAAAIVEDEDLQIRILERLRRDMK